MRLWPRLRCAASLRWQEFVSHDKDGDAEIQFNEFVEMDRKSNVGDVDADPARLRCERYDACARNVRVSRAWLHAGYAASNGSADFAADLAADIASYRSTDRITDCESNRAANRCTDGASDAAVPVHTIAVVRYRRRCERHPGGLRERC